MTDKAGEAQGKVSPSGSSQKAGSLFSKPTESAQAKAEIVKSEMKANAQQVQLDRIAGVQDLDWKRIPPPMLAQVLSQIPFKGSREEPDYYLTPVQAIVFAMRCYELGLSPFSNEVWFNPKNNKVNVTFEGKLKLARLQGFNLGPPHFTRITKPFESGKLIQGFKEDVGITCKIAVYLGNNKEDAEYTAWLSEWYVKSSPVWREKPEHMLQLRAAEKCVSFASGTGASEMPSDRDIDNGSEVPKSPEINIEVKE